MSSLDEHQTLTPAQQTVHCTAQHSSSIQAPLPTVLPSFEFKFKRQLDASDVLALSLSFTR